MSYCPECRRPVPADRAPGGLCPLCLLALGVATAPDAGAVEQSAPLPPRWQILTLLASGRYGTTYLAEQRAPSRRIVVVKLLATLDSCAAGSRRLDFALPSLMSLDHPAVVPVVGGGLTEDGVPYLVSSYVAGASLARSTCRQAALDARVRGMVRIAGAVCYLHGRGLAHGHLAPGNVLVPPHACGDWCVTDAGIAAIAGADSSLAADLTALGDLVRTLVPERAAVVDGAASAGEIQARLMGEATSPAGPE